MIRVLILICILVSSIRPLKSQDVSSAEQFMSLTAGFAKFRGAISLDYHYNLPVWKSRKFYVGAGPRFSSFYGVNQYYITAPAELTSESTSPLILFKQNVVENIDSVLMKAAQVNALNLMINLGYRFNAKFFLGFNIDVIGFSFGGRQHGNYINGNVGKNTSAKPTSFNLLLISDNDRGALNSELYLNYAVSSTWKIHGAAQFLFTEYTTSTTVQEFPKANDRFRNKSLMLAIGVAYQLNAKK